MNSRINLTDDNTGEKDFVTSFFAGEVSGSEFDLLETWLAESAGNMKEFDEKNKIWQDTNLHAQNESFNASKGWEKVSGSLGFGRTCVQPVIMLSRKVFTGIVAAASAAILILSFTNLFLWRNDAGTGVASAGSSVTKIQTGEGEKASIMLPDSTVVFINSESTLEYSSDFNISDRRLRLHGEAYFDVATDTAKPFQVHLGKITVVATGTRFNILSYGAENRIETTLEEGSVHVEIPGKETIGIVPGQQVIYFKNGNSAEVRNVTAESFTSWKEHRLRLNDTPFEEALRNIARRYNVVFEIQDPRLLELKYTATFIDESIEDVMQMLKTVSPIKYQIVKRTAVSDKTYVKPKITVTHR
ncbi:MAG: FecR domain-containing protein [Bacteroidales bacterium]|jgi:ferric-dicitrate binding protein FerR (iron transport regulator)|nr:FecR domain-containing protein [Bacteroidales bacterium]